MKDMLLGVVREKPWAVMATIMATHLVVALLAFDPVLHTGGDNTAYLALARSLLDHGRYLELWDPARPPHTQYPPGFPLLLAAVWALGVQSWAGLKLLMVGFTVAAVGLSYLWFRERLGPMVAAGLGFLLAVAPGLASESQWVLSDIPFWAVTMGALLALARGKEGWGTGLAFVALTLRTAGLPLVVAIIAWQAFRKRWKATTITLGILVLLAAAWTIRSSGIEAPYVSQFWLDNPYNPEEGRVTLLGLFERMATNAERYGFRFLMRTLTGGVGLIGAIGGSVLLAAAVVGFARYALGLEPGDEGGPARGEEDADSPAADPAHADAPDEAAPWWRPGLVELFAVLYGGMLLLWPYQWASDRFLIPFLPVVLAYAVASLAILPSPAVRSWVRLAAGALILGFAIPPAFSLWNGAAACRQAVEENGAFACLPSSERAFLELAEWSEGRLPEDAVIISRKPRLWYWHSGYPGEVYPFAWDRSELLAQARELEARYVVLDELGGTAQAYLLPAVSENRTWFCVIQRVTVRDDASATLLGVLQGEWDPVALGVDPESEALRLPYCPASYRSDQGGA